VYRIATMLSACLLLALTACATAEQIAARDDRVCQSYGAAAGSDSYVACRTQQRQLGQQQIDSAMADIAHMYDRRQSPSIDCGSTTIGDSVHTHRDSNAR
jgi:hypothetical protein